MRRHVLKSPEIQHIILHLFKDNTKSLHHMGYIHLVGKITGWIFFLIASQDAMTIRKAVVQCQELQKSGKLQDQSERDPES